MEDICYKVKIRTFCDSYDNFFEDVVTIPVPKNVINIEGFMNYFLGVTKNKDTMIEILEYELCEE